MGGWYTVGIVAGLGVACGVLAAALLPRVVVAAAGGAAGGLLGGAGAVPVVAGALRRGGTRGATAVIVAGVAVVAAGLAFVPALGYVETVVLPALAVRLRRREPERYAGLRTLARD